VQGQHFFLPFAERQPAVCLTDRDVEAKPGPLTALLEVVVAADSDVRKRRLPGK
jgi:hypothetical protein